MDATGEQDDSAVGFRFWLLLTATGIGAGLIGAALMALLRAVQHSAWKYSSGSFLDGVRAAGPWRCVIALVLAGVVVVVGRRLGNRVPSPVPGKLESALRDRAGRLPPWRTLYDGVLSIIVVGLGAPLGREGALKHCAAAFADRLVEWTGPLPEAQRRLLVACGAGAGLAAAYNVPLGGTVFVVEVLLESVAPPTMLAAFLSASLATLVSWVALPNQPAYLLPAFDGPPLMLICWSLVAGPLLGLAAAALAKAIDVARRGISMGPFGLWTMLVFAAIGVMSIVFPQLPGNGRSVVQLTYTDNLTGGALLVLIVLKPVVTFACLKTGTPGGLFTPLMACGALFGEGLRRLLPDSASVPGTCALIGSGAFMAAATQAPLSSIVFVLELTYRLDGRIVPLLLAVFGAVGTARMLGTRGIYAV